MADSKRVVAVEVTQVTDNTSTGAVKMPEPEQVVAEYHGADAVDNVPMPGAVTMSVSWLPEAKVVSPKDAKKSVETSAVAETK